MPLYEYECVECGKRTEVLQKFADEPLAVCPSCGGKVKKLFSSPAFQFKGSGWYATDYAGKKAPADAGSESPAGDKSAAKSGEKSEGAAETAKTSSASSPASSSEGKAGSSASAKAPAGES